MSARHLHHLQSRAPSDEEVADWIGARVVDGQGSGVGKVEDVYRVEGKPEWLLVRHHRAHVVVPVRGAVGSDGAVFLPYTHQQIKSAPRAEPREPLDPDAIETARRHYGL
jgi:ribosomal 30S subunit maturation factor RimM